MSYAAKKGNDGNHGIVGFLARKGCRLETLFLQGNAIGVKGAFVLAQGLCMNQSLKVLDLSRNELGHKGIGLVAEALAPVKNATKNLLSFDTSYCNIGNEGAKSLAELLIKLPTLAELRVQGNKISQDGMIPLFKSLSQKTQIKLSKKQTMDQSVSKLKILDISQNVL